MVVKSRMYIKTKCTRCGNPDFHNIRVHGTQTPSGPAIKSIEISDSISEEDMVSYVIHTVHRYIRDGIEVKELCGILTRCYGIAADYCCDLIQRIKLELDMYCPDRRHLYYVNQATSSEI